MYEEQDQIDLSKLGNTIGDTINSASYGMYVKIQNDTNVEISNIQLSGMNNSEWQSLF